MAIKLRQSTASQEVPLGYFVDSTDGNTEETALTIANTDIKLWKMGATSLANKNSGGATHMANGLYYCVLDATDTNTLGALVVFVHVSGALAVRVECEVLPAAVYDALIAGTGYFQSNAVQISGDGTAADNLEAMLDGTRAKLYLSQLSIVASGNDTALVATGAGTGNGIAATGGTTGIGLVAQGGDGGGGDGGPGMYVHGGENANGLHLAGGALPDVGMGYGTTGLRADGLGTSAGMIAFGGDEGGAGFEVTGGTGGVGLLTVGAGGMAGISAQNDASAPALLDNGASVEDMVWDAVIANHVDSGTTGAALDAGGGGGGDIASINGSAPAAVNLRKMFDGTGYAAGTSSIGSVTGTTQANLVSILGSVGDASLLGSIAHGAVGGAAVAGTLTTTEMTTNLAETTNNHFKPPQVVKFLNGPLAGQARAITGYVGATKKLQFAALTEAPLAGQTFIII